MSEDVKVNSFESINTIARYESVDLSLSMKGGLLAHICLIMEGKDSSITALLCPGYGISEESTLDIQNEPEVISMVPEPDQSDILLFDEPTSGVSIKAVLSSSLSDYNTLNIYLSPELTIHNQTNKPAIFRVRTSRFRKENKNPQIRSMNYASNF